MKKNIFKVLVLIALSTKPCFSLDNFFIIVDTKCNEEFRILLQDAFGKGETIKISDWDNKANFCDSLAEFNLYKAMLFQITNQNKELYDFVSREFKDIKDPKMIMMLGYAYIRNNKIEKAELVAKFLEENFPFYPYGCKLRGNIYHYYGEYQKAIDSYAKAHRYFCWEDDTHITVAMAETYHALKNYGQSCLSSRFIFDDSPLYYLFQDDSYKLKIIESFIESKSFIDAGKLLSKIKKENLDSINLHKYKELEELYEISMSEIK